MALRVESNELLLSYKHGDHFAIYPKNRVEIVNRVIDAIKNLTNPDQIIKIEHFKENSKGTFV